MTMKRMNSIDIQMRKKKFASKSISPNAANKGMKEMLARRGKFVGQYHPDKVNQNLPIFGSSTNEDIQRRHNTSMDEI